MLLLTGLALFFYFFPLLEGTLLTFVQFLFVAVVGLPSQFDRRRPPFFLKPNRVPLRRWLVNIVLFFSINVLNNHAFSYSISVPVHIILRSGGSITTMIAGSLYGKRYSRIQVVAVILLTIGVITAAWSDAQSKVCSITCRFSPPSSPPSSLSQPLSSLPALGLITNAKNNNNTSREAPQPKDPATSSRASRQA